MDNIVEALIILILLIVMWLINITVFYTLTTERRNKLEFYMTRWFIVGLTIGVTVFGAVVIVAFLI